MTTLQQEVAGRDLDLPTGFAEPCEGSVHHSPTPLVTRCYDLADLHRAIDCKGDAEDPVRLCGVCSDNLRVFILMSGLDDFPWEVQRRFGNAIRALGARALAHRKD